MALITVDKRPGSELGFVYIGAKKGKNDTNQRVIIHSTDSISKTLYRVNCEVETPGDLVVEPVRLTSMLEKRDPDDMVVFAKEGTRVTIRAGSARSTLSSRKPDVFDQSMENFPYNDAAAFQIDAAHLKTLLDRTASFIYKGGGQDGLKNVLIRAVKGGYEAVATNREVVAKASIEDPGSPFKEGASIPMVEIPGRALSLLTRMLSRKKSELIKVVISKTPEGVPAWAYFRTEEVFFGTGLSAQHLPPVDVVFSSQQMDTFIHVGRESLLDSIHRSDPFCVESTAGRLVSLEVKNSKVRLTAEDSGGDFEEEIAATGDAQGGRKATFQVGYLADVLRTSPEDNVILHLGTAGPNKKPSALVLAGAVLGNGASYVVGAVG
jgi:DNA polymerase III sliding clamp (beta) subunit (PCNA family)